MRRWHATYTAFLVVVAAILFAGVHDLGLDTHDGQLFRNNQALDDDWRRLLAPQATRENAAGRPVAELVKGLGYLAWGNDAGAYHLLVVALHTLAAGLLAVVARRLGHDSLSAAATGLLFLANVAHFQAVYHISALDYPLALCAGWFAVLCWLRYLATGGVAPLAGAAGGVILGLMSHLGAAAVLPFGAWLAWTRRASAGVYLRGLAIGAVAAAVSLLLVAGTARDTSTWRSLELYEASGLGELIVGWGRLLLWFLGRLLTTAHWLPLDVSRLHAWELAVGAAALAALGVAVWRGPPLWATWSVWVLASLAPFLLLTEATIRQMPVGPSRYLYAASAGTSALLALAGQALLRRLPWPPRRRRAAGGAALLVLVVVSGAALHRAEALFFYTSGRYHMSIGAEADAAMQLRRAIDRGDDRIPLLDAYLRLANIQMARGDDTARLADEARARIPQAPILAVLVAVHDAEAGGDDTAAALARIDALIAAQAQQGVAASTYDLRRMAGVFFGNRGLARMRREDFDGAVAPLTHALRYDPGHRVAAESLAYAWFRTGRPRAAAQLWARLGDTGNAAAAYEEVLRRDPDDTEARAHLEALRR